MKSFWISWYQPAHIERGIEPWPSWYTGTRFIDDDKIMVGAVQANDEHHAGDMVTSLLGFDPEWRFFKEMPSDWHPGDSERFPYDGPWPPPAVVKPEAAPGLLTPEEVIDIQNDNWMKARMGDGRTVGAATSDGAQLVLDACIDRVLAVITALPVKYCQEPGSYQLLEYRSLDDIRRALGRGILE